MIHGFMGCEAFFFFYSKLEGSFVANSTALSSSVFSPTGASAAHVKIVAVIPKFAGNIFQSLFSTEFDLYRF